MPRSRTLCLIAFAALAAAPLTQAQDSRYYGYEGRPEYDDGYPDDERYRATTYRPGYEDEYSNDHILHDRVHRAIERALGRDAYGIRIDVRGGHAQLSGTVRNGRVRRIAHDVAHQVPGIHGVMVGRLYVGRRWQ
jgi:hypothetical protein